MREVLNGAEKKVEAGGGGGGGAVIDFCIFKKVNHIS